MAVRPAVLEPAEEPSQLRADDGLVLEPAEKDFNRIQHYPLGLDFIHGSAEADEKAVEIVLARFFNLAALNKYMVDRKLAFALQLVEVEAHRGDVLRQVALGFFKGHEDARLVVVENAVNKEFHPQDSLARSRAAAD